PTRIDLVDLHMTEWISRDLFAGPLHLGQDRVHSRALGDEEVDRANPVHRLVETLGLRLKIENRLRDIDAMDLPGLPTEANLWQPGSSIQPLSVRLCRGGSQPAAVSSHDLVNEQHPRSRVVLADDMLCETGC